MPLMLLFDLDGTLLDTNMDTFVPAYFQALSKHLNHLIAPEVMLGALIHSTTLMYNSTDPAHTLQEVFEADFYSKLGIVKEELLEIIDDFYDHVFPSIRDVTTQRPDAAPLISWAFERGYRVAIATDPLFPRKATYHRLRWAGLNPEQFELVSTFESFHFTKTHSAYYAEVLGQLGWPDGPVLMVGNDIQRDLVPANKQVG
jgi:FMN phosphatase YigB (HAD superfamily)